MKNNFYKLKHNLYSTPVTLCNKKGHVLTHCSAFSISDFSNTVFKCLGKIESNYILKPIHSNNNSVLNLYTLFSGYWFNEENFQKCVFSNDELDFLNVLYG